MATTAAAPGQINTIADLLAALTAYKAKPSAGAKARIIARAKFLKATHRLPADWRKAAKGKVPAKGQMAAPFAKADQAGELNFDTASGLIDCPECTDRAFLDEHALGDHAEAVHTFNDIQQLVSEYVREKFGRRGDYQATPVVPSIWVYVNDMATDWVVYSVESDDCTLYKASYSITDNQVTLGEPVEVVRKTVYEPIQKADS